MNFKSWLNEGRFDTVDLGGRSPNQVLKRFRLQLFESIESILNDPDNTLTANNSIKDLLEYLRD